LNRATYTEDVSTEQKPIAARVASLIGIAPEGTPLTVAIAAAGVVVLVLGPAWIGVVLLLIALAVGAFFRDPTRTSSAAQDAITSGADGRVCAVGEGRLPGFQNQVCHLVSVFMSPLNVHVNRAPVSGEVVSIEHTPGEFRAAFHDAASEHNERNLIMIRDGKGRHHAMTQVAGYLARRIVCHLRCGQRIAGGQRIGLIMFGSRVDHFIPAPYRVAVKVGDRARAGITIIGEEVQ
jgi:phosphatidylserine decarboxylase